MNFSVKEISARNNAALSKLKRIVKIILAEAQDLWHVSKHTLFIVFMLVIGWVAFTVPDQAKDIFLKFNNENVRSVKLWSDIDKDFLLFFLLSTWLWAITIWYTTRLLLHLVQINSYNSRVVKPLIIWTPRVLGVFPFIISIRAIKTATPDSTYADWNISYWVLGISAVIFLVLAYLRRYFWYSEIKIGKVKWKDLHKSTQVIFYVLSGLAILIIIYFTVLPRSLSLAEKLGPASIVSLGLSVWTFFGMIFMYFGHRLRLPAFLFIALLFYFSSFYNDNHEVRYAEEIFMNDKGVLSLPLDKAYFENWLLSRKDEIKKADFYNVYIIAGEGGGIRAAYWTGSVLIKFMQQDSNFYHQIFALSTVSGSSLGAAYTQALYKDFILTEDSQNQLPADSILTMFRSMLAKEDHLSGVTSALLFPDFIQKFIPAKINVWDRARWLEDSRSFAYQKYTRNNSSKGLKTLDLSLLDLYRDVPAYSMPAIFFNATVTETGQKAVISNLRLSTNNTEQKSVYFYDVVDFHHLTGKAMPLKTSASVSARFPLITPPATVFDSVTEEPGAHFVDGGYFENTGLSTAMEIVYMINDIIDTTKVNNKIGGLEIQRKIRPTIIYLKNGDYESGKIAFVEEEKKLAPKITKPIRSMYELRTPITTFLGAWGRGGLNTSKNVSQIANKMIPRIKMYTKELKREKPVPLGWYLSKEASEYVDKQIDTLSYIYK